MIHQSNENRSPGVKLVLAAFIAVVLIVPLMMVYMLVYDRESQLETAQSTISAGWGGAQIFTGPLLVIPYNARNEVQEATVDGEVRRVTTSRQHLYVSPSTQSIETGIDPRRKAYAIYESVVYETTLKGQARFDPLADLNRLGVRADQLLLDQAELRFGVSDPRGLQDDAKVTADGENLRLQPGSGPVATGGSGFSAFVDWNGTSPLEVSWNYGLRGSQSLTMVPRGGETEWAVKSAWPHPSYTGAFLPDSSEANGDGFTASYDGITNLALGQSLISTRDMQAAAGASGAEPSLREQRYGSSASSLPQDDGKSQAVTVSLVDPVSLYSQVNRAVKYGFLFIGFTFVAFLLFDIVGGARVAAVEYLMTGAGLILFFVMLLAFAEVIGFAWAYIVASAAIIGLLTAYSAAVLGTWKRAGFIGAMLAGLYGLLYALLNLETYALVIGSLLLFIALAGIMYATRAVNWSAVGRSEEADAIVDG